MQVMARIFALTVLEILRFEMVDLEKLGKGYVVQHLHFDGEYQHV